MRGHMTIRYQDLFHPSHFLREKPWERGCSSANHEKFPEVSKAILLPECRNWRNYCVPRNSPKMQPKGILTHLPTLNKKLSNFVFDIQRKMVNFKLGEHGVPWSFLSFFRMTTQMNCIAESVTSSSAPCTTRRNIYLENNIWVSLPENLNGRRNKMLMTAMTK